MPLLLNAREQLAAYVYFESFSTSPLLAACHLLSKHSLPVNSGFGKLADRIGIIVMQQQIQILRVCVYARVNISWTERFATVCASRKFSNYMTSFSAQDVSRPRPEHAFRFFHVRLSIFKFLLAHLFSRRHPFVKGRLAGSFERLLSPGCIYLTLGSSLCLENFLMRASTLAHLVVFTAQ